MNVTLTQNRIRRVPFPGSVKNSFGFYVFELARFLELAKKLVFEPYQAEFDCILFFTRGKSRHRVDFETYPCKAGSLLPVSRGQVQVFEPGADTQGYLIIFTDEFICRYATDMEWLMNLRLFSPDGSSPLLQLSDDDYEDFLWLAKNMHTELHRGSNLAGGEHILHNLLKVLILKAERLKSTQCKEAVKVSREHLLFVEFKKELESTYTSSRAVQDYARALGITPKKLNALTRHYLGKSAKQVIDERVVLEIKRLLTYSDLSVHEITCNLGFDDSTNMIKFFKRYAGITPAKFKNQPEKQAVFHHSLPQNHL